MRAKVTSFNRSLNNWQVQTESDIAVSFSIEDDSTLSLNEELEVDLLRVVELQEVVRVTNGQTIRDRLRAHDLHDLRLPSGHGTNRQPSADRLNGA